MQSKIDFDFVEADAVMSAERSPTMKVPFLEHGDLTLTDSSSILKFVREKAGGSFLAELEDFELFTIANTLLDASLNLFLLEKEGLKPEQVPYLARQKGRIERGLTILNDRIDPALGITTDSALRVACFIGWGLFRERFTLDGLSNLQGLMDSANQTAMFTSTAPPA